MRSSTVIRVPELPWSLRFYWATVADDSGGTRLVCVGVEIGDAVSRSEAAEADTDDVELTPHRVAILFENWAQYEQLARNVCLRPVDRVDDARRIRSGMRRRRWARLTDDYLQGLVAEWRGYGGARGAIHELAEHRTRIRAHLVEAERRGLVPEGLPRRKRDTERVTG